MRVKDLIAELQKCDPETPISNNLKSISELPAYYDGSCEYIENGKNIITRKGKKIKLHFFEPEDRVLALLWMNRPYPSFEEVLNYFILDTEHPRVNETINWLKEIYLDTIVQLEDINE